LRKKRILEKQKRMVQPRFQPIEPINPQTKLSHLAAVRPLQTLPSLGPALAEDNITSAGVDTGYSSKPGLKRFSDWGVKKVGAFKESAAALWLSIGEILYGMALKIFPKRYKSESGVIVDWQAKSFSRMKVAVPLFLGLLLLSLKIWGGPATAPSKLGNFPSSGQSSSAANPGSNGGQKSKNDSNNNSASASGISPAKPISTGSSTTATGSSGGGSVPAQSSLVPTVTSGGMGGGGYSVQVPNPAPMPSPTNSLPPTTTVTVPPTAVQVGDKPLLNISGTSITGN
jgi:hypothetical protein